MAVSRNPARCTDAENVVKWFKRNCGEVLGRACTAAEKGDFITFMSGQQHPPRSEDPCAR